MSAEFLREQASFAYDQALLEDAERTERAARKREVVERITRGELKPVLTSTGGIKPGVYMDATGEVVFYGPQIR